jgi:hypothetical protein
MNLILTLVIYTFAVAAISLTVTKSALFAGVRHVIFKKTYDRPLLENLNTLFECPFCFSFWASLTILLVMPVPEIDTVQEFVLYTFALMGAGSLVASLIYSNFKGAIH